MKITNECCVVWAVATALLFIPALGFAKDSKSYKHASESGSHSGRAERLTIRFFVGCAADIITERVDVSGRFPVHAGE